MQVTKDKPHLQERVLCGGLSGRRTRGNKAKVKRGSKMIMDTIVRTKRPGLNALGERRKDDDDLGTKHNEGKVQGLLTGGK